MQNVGGLAAASSSGQLMLQHATAAAQPQMIQTAEGPTLIYQPTVQVRYFPEAPPRQGPWRHIFYLGLELSKPGWSAQGCTRQSQAAIDGTRGLVWLTPELQKL